jgi:circadian clock protein KaiB
MEPIELELYVVGGAARSQAAVTNLARICRTWLAGRCHVTVVDVLEQPEAAEAANVVATPLLIRRSPLPVRRLVGDLSHTQDVLRGLGVDEDTIRAGGPDG